MPLRTIALSDLSGVASDHLGVRLELANSGVILGPPSRKSRNLAEVVKDATRAQVNMVADKLDAEESAQHPLAGPEPFARLAGTRAWRASRKPHSDWWAENGSPLCTWRKTSGHRPVRQLMVNGRAYELRRGDRRLRRLPGTSVSLHNISRSVFHKEAFELVDALSGRRMLSVEGVHFEYSAGSRVTTSTARYSFPVWREPGPERLWVMAAADESGTVAARFAKNTVAGFKRIEVAVTPEQAPTTELICLIAVAADFVQTFPRVRASGA